MVVGRVDGLALFTVGQENSLTGQAPGYAAERHATAKPCEIKQDGATNAPGIGIFNIILDVITMSENPAFGLTRLCV